MSDKNNRFELSQLFDPRDIVDVIVLLVVIVGAIVGFVVSR